MDSFETKDPKKMGVGEPNVQLNKVPVVPDSTNHFVQASTSFDAYPLESSSDFLNNENGVIFMPLTPTDLPLSFQERQPKVNQSSQTVEQCTQQPICHGFFFPYSSTEDVPAGSFSTQDVYHQAGQTATVSLPNEGHQFLLKPGTDNLGQPSENEVQLLLLQKLIALQLANQLAGSTPVGHEIDESSLPYNPPLEVPPTFPPEGRASMPLPPLGQNMSTYLIPVEATLHDNRGLALHITPRTDLPDGTSNPGIKMECPTDQLVLYPYAPKTPSTNKEQTSPDTITSAKQKTAPAQTLTINDIKSCIRRGSLEVPLDNNVEIVNSIRGHKKPGFVLLSIRHEKVTNEDKTSVPIDTHTIAPDVYVELPPLYHPNERASAPPVTQSSRRTNKRRQRLLRADTDPQRRSVRKAPRLSTQLQTDTEQPTEVNAEQTSLIPISRFRVSRFADKKQVWLAPSGTGCFTVHDLWTTKLPDYVLKKIKQLEEGKETNSEHSSGTDASCFNSDAVPDTRCTVCQSTQPQPCECGGKAPI